MPLTVGKLKEVLEDLDDDMLVGVSGYFGEMYPFFFPPSAKNTSEADSMGKPQFEALLFDHVDIGEEPD